MDGPWQEHIYSRNVYSWETDVQIVWILGVSIPIWRPARVRSGGSRIGFYAVGKVDGGVRSIYRVSETYPNRADRDSCCRQIRNKVYRASSSTLVGFGATGGIGSSSMILITSGGF